MVLIKRSQSKTEDHSIPLRGKIYLFRGEKSHGEKETHNQVCLPGQVIRPGA